MFTKHDISTVIDSEESSTKQIAEGSSAQQVSEGSSAQQVAEITRSYQTYHETFLSEKPEQITNFDPSVYLVSLTDFYSQYSDCICICNRKRTCKCSDKKECLCDDDQFSSITLSLETSLNCTTTCTVQLEEAYQLKDTKCWRIFILKDEQEIPLITVNPVKKTTRIHSSTFSSKKKDVVFQNKELRLKRESFTLQFDNMSF